MIKTILVPTDGSDHARKAVGLATDLAFKYEARMVLLHVFSGKQLPESVLRAAEIEHVSTHIDDGSGGGLVNIPQEIMARVGDGAPSLKVMRFASNKVFGDAAKAAHDAGVKDVKTEIEEGDPARRILACAERENADTIVMGSRGMGDLKGLLMGGVSHKVGQLSDCTLITVR
jgi:nucleotide-binding universal stress UspA family protein